jgi:hypothetical protein
MSWGYETAEEDRIFSRVMRTEDHVDHDDGHNEQDNGNDNGCNDNDSTINCWQRFGGRIREKGTSWGGGTMEVGQKNFKGDVDNVNRIDDGNDGADCGDDDGRDNDNKDEHFDNAGIKYNSNDGDGNGNYGDHDEHDGIGGDEDESTINNNETMTV